MKWWWLRSSIITTSFFWMEFILVLSCCSIWKYGMIVDLDLIWFLIINILDLPKLTTISFNGDWALKGDGRDNRRTTINGHGSYDNTLIMKSILKFKLKVIWVVVDNNDCLDLPSLTSIQGQVDCLGIHCCMGRVILESMIWFDFTMIRHSKSHSKQHWLWKKIISPHCWYPSNK